MQHLGARSSNRKPRPRAPTTSSVLPDGWFSIEPQSRKPNARPGPDALGLTNTVDPLTFVARKAQVQSSRWPSERGARDKKEQNPRQKKIRPASDSVFSATEVFSPQRSLRLTKLPLLTKKERFVDTDNGRQPNQSAASTPMQAGLIREAELPLHELIQTVDDAVKADPLAELNQSAIARLFMDQWLRQFEADRRNFKSVAVRYEVGFEELYRRTVNLPKPNELITTFCCKVLEDLTPHFGLYAHLFRVLSAELIQSIYAHDGLPYFALVKHHKRVLLTLRNDKEWREERNNILADDIGNVYAMFRRFLSECTFALSRMLLHEWYSVAIVQKKNNRKYIAYFSTWFSVAPKAIIRKVFVTWKREAAVHRIEKIQKQKQIDLQGLTAIKRQADEFIRQRDIAQADNLAMRSDRKQAEDWTRNLELRIKAASLFLDTTRRREVQVCEEGQLRVEAVACLPPLILESLLRGYHGVGFLQHTPLQEGQVGSLVLVDEMRDSTDQKNETSSVLQECFAEIEQLRGRSRRRTSISMHMTPTGRSNSVVAASGRSDSVVSVPSVENGEQSLLQGALAAAATTGSSTSRRAAAGAVSQDELSGRTFSNFFRSVRERIQATEAKVLFTTVLQVDKDKQPSRHENAEVAREFENLMRAISVQDEHYAKHSKLFSSRMLENHEISLVPSLPILNQALSVADGFAGSDKGDLGHINGVKRFWVTSIAANKPRTVSRSSQLRRAPTRRQSVFMPKEPTQFQIHLLENLELLHKADFDISPLHSRGFTILMLAHLATAFGSLLFSPADMSAFTHGAYVQPPIDKVNSSRDSQVLDLQDLKKVQAGEGKALATSTSAPPQNSSSPNNSSMLGQATESLRNVYHSLRIIEPVVAAYSTWNQISEQLISTGVVQSRGHVLRAVDSSTEVGNGEMAKVQGIPMRTPIRPILQHQFEPLSHISFLAPTRDKGGRQMSSSSGDGNTYHTARIRNLSADGPERLIQSMEAIHKSVKNTSVKMQDFRAMHQQLRELRATQWQQASELASQFASKPKEAPIPTTAANLTDTRDHVCDCISLTNSTMRRIFSVEDDPEVELIQVRAIFEKHQRTIRQLYTPFRANIKHAMSLDDLWHFVKILRLPREIHVLPILRDEELVANGYEQLFSPDDLTELFLQLCNEQFQPHITPLSARVEYFTTHHLPIAVQNQSLIRVLMHRSDIKLAIGSHSQTIRIIFRRYCAKERELVAPVLGATKPKPRLTGHGINKYMRMVDWQAFVQDYHLVRARFSMDQAMNVFRNVQEATAGSDDQLELIYSEFCEAIVAMAVSYFPDPFLKTATKVTQFLRRYLPLSPDEAHDHA